VVDLLGNHLVRALVVVERVYLLHDICRLQAHLEQPHVKTGELLNLSTRIVVFAGRNAEFSVQFDFEYLGGFVDKGDESASFLDDYDSLLEIIQELLVAFP
jgi:hypothetical protein